MVCETPVDGAIQAAGHEPNGYFWEGIARFLSPELADAVDYTSEGSEFVAIGARAALEQLVSKMEPITSDAELVVKLIEQAERAGFEFDD